MAKLRPQIQTHIAYCYEQLCRDFVKNNFPLFQCLKVGRQWGKQYEIDVAGIDDQHKLVAVGECKWSRKKIGLSIYQELQEKIKTNKLPMATNCQYLFFSKAGFTGDLQKKAKQKGNIHLIDNIFHNHKE